jgi:23S rRNA (guanosine2251-2'-O)-methyltransferase
MATKQIFGFHSIEETLKGKDFKGSLLLARDAVERKKQDKLEQLISLAKQKGINVTYTNIKSLNTYANKDQHRGILLIVEELGQEESAPAVNIKDFLASFESEKALVLILDQITDPQNYGAILRSADQFAVDLVIIPERHSVKETQVVRATSSGAHVYVPVAQVTNLAQTIERLKEANFWIYGADMEGKPLDQTDLRGRVALVLGSEGKGLRQLIAEKCDEKIAIPTAGHVDSFNVSVAAGILMYEVRRQQSFFSQA